MNGYLVVLRHLMDDLPLLLTGDREIALEFADSLESDSGVGEKQLLRLDSSTPLNVWIYTFARGQLIEAVCVKEFEEVLE